MIAFEAMAMFKNKHLVPAMWREGGGCKRVSMYGSPKYFPSQIRVNYYVKSIFIYLRRDSPLINATLNNPITYF